MVSQLCNMPIQPIKRLWVQMLSLIRRYSQDGMLKKQNTYENQVLRAIGEEEIELNRTFWSRSM